MRQLLCASLAFAVLISGWPLAAEPLTIEQFREELLGVPLCGVPSTGPLEGKALCTVHLPDGTAVVAGSGILVRGKWEADENRICRRNPDDPLERQRCITYERVDAHHYRNSDGVVACIGPCPPSHEAQRTKPETPQADQSAPTPAPSQERQPEEKPADQ